MDRHYKRIFCRLILLALAAGLLAAAVAMKTPCLIRSMSGIPCPTCGMTRAWLACLRLDFQEAFSYHPMFWSIPVLALVYVLDGLPLPGKKASGAVYIAVLLGFGVTWLIRTVFFLSGIPTV